MVMRRALLADSRVSLRRGAFDILKTFIVRPLSNHVHERATVCHHKNDSSATESNRYVGVSTLIVLLSQLTLSSWVFKMFLIQSMVLHNSACYSVLADQFEKSENLILIEHVS